MKTLLGQFPLAKCLCQWKTQKLHLTNFIPNLPFYFLESFMFLTKNSPIRSLQEMPSLRQAHISVPFSEIRNKYLMLSLSNSSIWVNIKPAYISYYIHSKYNIIHVTSLNDWFKHFYSRFPFFLQLPPSIFF